MISFLEPEKIIEQIEIKQDYKAAEFGCGLGGFSIALAKKLSQGMLYAIDIQEEPLSALGGRAKAEGLPNIKTIKSDLEEPRGSTLQDDFLDLVLVTNILFQSDNKEVLLKEAKRIIKPKGKVVVVEWRPGSPFGPEKGRISFEEVRQIMMPKLDMKLIRELDAGTYHWAAVFQK